MIDKPPGIFWLASYPKSGNTWVRMFLNAYHTGVCNINLKFIANASDIKPAEYHAVAKTDLKDLPQEYLFFYRQAALLNMALSSDFSPNIIKTHSMNGSINEVATIPTALTDSAVYLIRDPRDVVVSYAKHMNRTIDESIVALATPSSMITEPNVVTCPVWIGSWTNNVVSWEQREYTTMIRYEDLLVDPEEGFAQILKTFRTKVVKRKLRRAIKLSSLEELMKQEDKKGFVEKKNQERFFGGGEGWRNVLTEEQARRIEADHRSVMEKYYGLAKDRVVAMSA